jgi:hypothetical protein
MEFRTDNLTDIGMDDFGSQRQIAIFRTRSAVRNLPNAERVSSLELSDLSSNGRLQSSARDWLFVICRTLSE